MLIDAQATDIPGCLILSTRVHRDIRGSFQKTYHKEAFDAIGISEAFLEHYYSMSRKNVVRGMHYQAPPAQHSKIVCCVYGRAFDVVLDIRRNSPTFGRHVAFYLEPNDGKMIYVPVGCAHGFMSLQDDTIISYQVSSIHSPEHDLGILWNSFNCEWPVKDAIISARDSAFIDLENAPSYF